LKPWAKKKGRLRHLDEAAPFLEEKLPQHLPRFQVLRPTHPEQVQASGLVGNVPVGYVDFSGPFQALLAQSLLEVKPG